MKCPYCGHSKCSEVLYIIHLTHKKNTIRRRHCLKCDGRYTTQEIVIKADKAKNVQTTSA